MSQWKQRKRLNWKRLWALHRRRSPPVQAKAKDLARIERPVDTRTTASHLVSSKRDCSFLLNSLVIPSEEKDRQRKSRGWLLLSAPTDLLKLLDWLNEKGIREAGLKKQLRASLDKAGLLLQSEDIPTAIPDQTLVEDGDNNGNLSSIQIIYLQKLA